MTRLIFIPKKNEDIGDLIVLSFTFPKIHKHLKKKYMEIVLAIVIIIVVLIVLSLFGWLGKLLELLFEGFTGGLGNCVGCLLHAIFWPILIFFILGAALVLL